MRRQMPTSPQTVLLIDSDVQVLSHCARILEDAQHHVLMATGCLSAEMLCGWYRQEVHLILADLMLYAVRVPSAIPHVSADQLAGDRVFRLAHRRWPLLRIALMAATIMPPPELVGDRFEVRARYLQKPVDQHALLRLLEPTLEGSPLDTCVAGCPEYTLHEQAGQTAFQ